MVTILGVHGGGRRVMNEAPPTMVRTPVTLTITPTTSTACVVINPTTSSTIPINTAEAAATVRRSQTGAMVCLAANLGSSWCRARSISSSRRCSVLGEWHGSFSRPDPTRRFHAKSAELASPLC